MIIGQIRAWLRKILNLGIRGSHSIPETQRIYLTNAYCLIGGSITLFYLPVYLYLGIMPLAITAFITLLGLITGLLLNAKEHYFTAKVLALFFTSLLLFVHGLVLGKEAFIQMMYLPLILGMTLIFDYNRRSALLVAVSIPLVFMVALEVLSYGQGFMSPLEELPIGGIYYLNYAVSISSSFIVMYFFIRLHRGQSTALQQQAEELKESRDSLMVTSKVGRIGFSEVDFQSNTLSWGPELRYILGVSPDFVPQTDNVFTLIHPDDRERIQEAFQKTRNNGEPFEVDYRFIRPVDGRVIHIQSIARIIGDASGKPAKMLSIIKDITEDKEKEDLIRQAKERAETANMAKSQFLSNISHEIRTPLHGLLGFANLLEESDLNKDQQLQLSMIQYSGKTLMALLNDLLDLTRIEQGKMVLREKPIQIAELLKSCLDPYQLQARDKNLSLTVECHCDSYPLIVSDPLRIKQMLINLVNNAIKYTAEGAIHVSLEMLPSHDGNTSTADMHIQVSDTGPGIPRDRRDSIFQSFTQLDSPNSAMQGGLGLGLAIVKNLVTLMHGTLGLESPCNDDPDRPGSCFSITLPVKVSQMLSVEESAQKHSSGIPFGLQILVAEDNEINQLLLKNFLENIHAEVTVVENGKEAFKRTMEKNFDLILMDVQMPVMSGYESARAIRKKMLDVPILALSANAYEEDIRKSMLAGMNGHLSKPFHVDELYRQISLLVPARQLKETEK